MQDQNNIFNTDLGQKLLVLTRAGFTISNQINDLIIRDKVKGKILDIYESFSSGMRHGDLLKEIEILDNLLHLSGHLGMAKNEHIKKLQNGYLVFKSRIVLSQQPPLTFGRSSVSSMSGVEINTENSKISDTINKTVNLRKEQIKVPDTIIPVRAKISERHGKILNFIHNNGGKAQLANLMNLFPKLSEKSVRNDLAQLCSESKLKRIGWGPTSYYQINI